MSLCFILSETLNISTKRANNDIEDKTLTEVC